MRRLGIVGLGLCLVLVAVGAAQGPPICPQPQTCPQQVCPHTCPALPIDHPALPPNPFPHEPDLPPPPVQNPDAQVEFGHWEFDVETLFAAPEAEEPTESKILHLLKAAEHLEAAGFGDHAALLRRIAQQEQAQPLLAEKLKQLEALRAEVKRLRNQTAPTRQIMLQVQVVELSRTKLRKLGVDFHVAGAAARAANGAGHEREFFQCHISKAEENIQQVIQSLREADLLKVLASPTLVTTSGHPASFWSGGECPVVVPKDLGETSVEYKKFGTSLEFVPVILKSGKVRLEMRHRISTVDHGRSVQVGRHTLPGLRVREMDAGFELAFGQTLVLARAGQTPTRRAVRQTGCTRRADNHQDQTEVLVLITPQRVDPLNPPKTTGPLAEKPDGMWWRKFFMR